MSQPALRCFKAYDVRGRVPQELNADIAYRIGRSFAVFVGGGTIAVGHDIRLSSPQLTEALANGMTDQGADVLHLGQCGTEEMYFAAFNRPVSGAVAVTASHNPEDWNGMKFVAAEAQPVSGETGLKQIQAMAERAEFPTPDRPGRIISAPDKRAYIDHLLGYIDHDKLRPLKIIVNAGNGAAGPVVDLLETQLPFKFIKLHHEPDGRFPNGVPNPLLVQNREETSAAIIEHGADLGLAWDGDFDRCFFFDEAGTFIPGYYVAGLLARIHLQKYPGSKIIHDPRLTWHAIESAAQAGGIAVQCKTGHAFIKERMRSEDAAYGGEISAHHYFRDFAYCDSGMIPWLLVSELLSMQAKPLSDYIKQAQSAHPCSDEINIQVDDPVNTIQTVADHFQSTARSTEYVDGLSMEFADWRFNLRMSNTEPILRLNLETRADLQLLAQKTFELTALIKTSNIPATISAVQV